MSDYIFHPRVNDKNMNTLQYYTDNRYPNGNPFLHFHPTWALECYAYARFWEIVDTVTTVNPYDLGKVSYYLRSDPDTRDWGYMRGFQWYDAQWDFIYPVTTYMDVENDDNYGRLDPNHTPIDQRILGSALVFTENPFETAQSIADLGAFRVLIGEKYKSIGNYTGSGIEGGSFTLSEVINNQFTTVTGYTLTLRGVIKNPIHDMFDNVIQGHPLYWKLPFWMYKRYLDRRRGLLYE